MARSAALSNPATLDELAVSLTTGTQLVDLRGRHLTLAPEVVEAFQEAIAELQSPTDDLTTEETAVLLGVFRRFPADGDPAT